MAFDLASWVEAKCERGFSKIIDEVEEVAFALAEKWPRREATNKAEQIQTIATSEDYARLISALNKLPKKIVPNTTSARSVLVWVIQLTSALGSRRLGNGPESRP